ncbi:thiamine pyrophosphate-requiring protein [Actinomadura vinacea]|uniref:Thiamine pyrophosphate-requiring protein n=1 Tax=Actinomadura vinacea TaxID=115336 RepID=A0ABN3JX61_9ACTN
MAHRVADHILARLREWGVRRVYGCPGDGIGGFGDAFDRAGGDPELVRPRRVEAAAFMAAGHARFTGGVGVCAAADEAAAIRLLSGLYDAALDRVPVVALVGQRRRASLGAGGGPEVGLIPLFSDVAEYAQVCATPAQARHLVDQAMRTAAAARGVAVVIVPADVLDEHAVTVPPHGDRAVFSGVGVPAARPVPPAEDLEAAAAVLNRGSRVAILVGQGARGAGPELVQAADVLGAGVAKALLGRDVLPDELPFVTGPIGFLGSRPSDEMVTRCDTLLVVGTGFPYAEWLPEEGRARVVQIDADPRRISARVPVEVGLAGDAGLTLRGLIPLLRYKGERDWRRGIEEDVGEWWRILRRQARQRFEAINPQLVAWELNGRLPDGVVLTCDPGAVTAWWARWLRLREGMRAALSGTLGACGSAVPYAIAARLAFPDRPVIAFVDGEAFQADGMNEMATVAGYRDRLAGSGAPLVFAVFSAVGRPGSRDSAAVPCAAFADLAGLRGISCRDPERVGAVWEEALEAGGPVVLEFTVDAGVVPLPPHIMFDQARQTARAWWHDPDRFGAAAAGFRQKLAEFVEVRRHY